MMRLASVLLALCVVAVVAQNATQPPIDKEPKVISPSGAANQTKKESPVGGGAAVANRTSPRPATGVRNRTRTGGEKKGGVVTPVPAPSERNATGGNRTVTPVPPPKHERKANRTTRTEKHTGERRSVCFPSTSRVATPGGGSILMSALKVGDKVLTSTDGGVQEDTVYSFLHTAPTMRSRMVRVMLDGDNALTLSPRHVLFTCDDTPVFAQDIKGGDCVQRVNGQATVSGVEQVTAHGAFAPLTHSGKLFVDGVLVSNYAELTWHNVVHAAFAPLRFVHRMMPWKEAPIRDTAESVHPYAMGLRAVFATLLS